MAGLNRTAYDHRVSVRLDDIRDVLALHAPSARLEDESVKRAAVAAVFRETPALQLLFIRRAENPRDHWSGHMAFPGGRVDVEDSGPLAAAHRETKEELDLDLTSHGRLIGRLSVVSARPRRPVPLVVFPYVFEVDDVPPLRPDENEVAEALWVPMAYLQDLENRETMTYEAMGRSYTLPCYRYEGRQIWGMTLSMVDELLRLLGMKV